MKDSGYVSQLFGKVHLNQSSSFCLNERKQTDSHHLIFMIVEISKLMFLNLSFIGFSVGYVIQDVLIKVEI